MQMLHSLKCRMLMLTSSRHEKRLLWKHMQYCLEHKATFYIRNFFKNQPWTNKLVGCQIRFRMGKNHFVICSQTEIFLFRNNKATCNGSISIIFWIVFLVSEQKSNFILKEFLLKQIHLYIPMCWSLHLIFFL